MFKKLVRSAQPKAPRRGSRARRLQVESLESRKLLASVITGMSATPVVEGNATTLTVNFTSPGALANTYNFAVDWGDGGGLQVASFIPTVVAGDNLRATFTHTYADDNATDAYTIRGAVIDSTSISYWNFDEASGLALDSIGSNHGVLEGQVTRVPGLIGPRAVNFTNTAGDAVNVGTAIGVSQGLTIEALIRPTWTAGNGNYDEIFRKEDGGNRILFAFQDDVNNGGARIPVPGGPVLSLGLNIGGYGELDMPLNRNLSDTAAFPVGGNASSGTIYLDPPGGALGPNDVVLKDGATHHIAATYDAASGEAAIWIDGVKRWSFNHAPGTPIVSGGGAVAYIGNTAGGGEPYTNVIDEVAIYNRALTAQAIADHRAQAVAGRNYFEKTTTVAVTNAGPAFDLGANATISEGGTFTRAGSFTDVAGDTFTATVNYGDGSGVQPLTLTGNTFNLSRQYANNGAFTVTVVINDEDGGSTTDTLLVTVNNVAATVGAITGTATVNEGSTASISVGFTDPALTETYTASIDWGDGSTTVGVVNQATRTVTGTHPYVNQGTFNVVVTVNDGVVNSSSAPFAITVNNVLPVMGAAVATTPINEGSSTSLSVPFTDPGLADVHVATINWGDGSALQTVNLAVGTRVVAASHTYAQDGAYSVSIVVNDGVGTSVPSATASVTVNNVQPTIDAGAVIVGAEGSAVTLSATFTDPGVLDTHVATINWGDGSLPQTINLAVGARTIGGTHTYADNGNYTVTVTVTDGASPVVSDTTTANIANVAPTAVITGPASTVRGLPTIFVLSVTDPGTADLLEQYTYTISWGDGTLDEVVVGGAANVEVTHVFPVTSPEDEPFVVTVSATDKDGDTGADTEFEVTVVPFDVILNEETGLYDLVYGGTQFADRIVVSLRYNSGLQIRNNSTYYRGFPDFDGKVIIYGGDGADMIQVASHVPYQFEFFGGNGNDYIAGGEFDDILDGGPGNDRLLDNRGNNTFYGGDGNDSISAGSGEDLAFGGVGNDRIILGFGDDIADGGDGNDNLIGSDGDDILFGGAGNDTLRGDRGHDIIDGGLSNDTIFGLSGRDILIGGRGADSIYGGYDDDLIVHSTVDLGNVDPLTQFEDDIQSLKDIRDAWLAPLSLQDRITALSLTLNETTIADDNSRENIFGDSDEDWYLIASLLELRRLQDNDEYTLLYA